MRLQQRHCQQQSILQTLDKMDLLTQTARGLRNKPPKQALKLGGRGIPKYST